MTGPGWTQPDGSPLPRRLHHGDPEPDRTRRIRDRHGDVWSWNSDSEGWETPETKPFAWSNFRKAWFPISIVVERVRCPDCGRFARWNPGFGWGCARADWETGKHD